MFVSGVVDIKVISNNADQWEDNIINNTLFFPFFVGEKRGYLDSSISGFSNGIKQP
jgi:hypothetical protein